MGGLFTHPGRGASQTPLKEKATTAAPRLVRASFPVLPITSALLVRQSRNHGALSADSKLSPPRLHPSRPRRPLSEATAPCGWTVPHRLGADNISRLGTVWCFRGPTVNIPHVYRASNGNANAKTAMASDTNAQQASMGRLAA